MNRYTVIYTIDGVVTESRVLGKDKQDANDRFLKTVRFANQTEDFSDYKLIEVLTITPVGESNTDVC